MLRSAAPLHCGQPRKEDTTMQKTGCLCICLLALLAWYQPHTARAADNSTAAGPAAVDVVSTTHHRIKAGGLSLKYTATAGRLVIADEAGTPKARMFFIAYEKKGAAPGSRPITFAFNGGPGSSSVWLHFGAIGPRRVLLTDDGSAAPPPAALVENACSWLAFSDIVFIDPVGTGYSQALDKKKDAEFYGYKKDIESVGDFIRLYLTRNKRWLSPKYLVGESYGTTRAVGLTQYIHGAHGIRLSGIILISPVLDFNTILLGRSNDLPYVLFLPSYAAAAWYHRQLSDRPATLEQTLSTAEQWALQEYAAALARGGSLPPDRRSASAAAMAGLTGLAPRYILDSNLKVRDRRFVKELLRSRGRIIGRMDARITGPDVDTAGATGTYDPSLDRLFGPFAAAANHYVRHDLGFESDVPYRYLNPKVSRHWDWSSAIHGGQGYVNVSRELSDALNRNSHLRVFIACGYYDLATPYFAARYTVNHLDIEHSLRANITMRFYEAGHMMYTRKSSLEKLTGDVARFYECGGSGGSAAGP